METSTCATVASVGKPAWINRSGAGAWTTPSVQDRQAYLDRRVTMTRTCAGITSSRSDRSSPMRCRHPPQGQIKLSGSITSSIRGRWLGSEPRLIALGFDARLPCGASASSSAWTAAMAVSKSSSARSNWSRSVFSDLRPKAACLNAATSLSSRSIRSSLRTSRASAAISIAFRAAISSGRSTAFNMRRVYQIRPRFTFGICCPSHRAAATR